MKPLRVGVIGCGWISQNIHIPAYVENPKSKLAAVCDANEERLHEVAKRYDVKNVFVNHKDLLESGLVDAVSICTPTAAHCEVAVEAAEHGIHTLCEKPLASNLEEGKKIVQAVHQSEIKFMVGFNYRFLPNHEMTKKFIDAGRIGKPIFIKGEVVTPGPYKTDIPEKDYSFEAKKRIGAFFDLGSHLVDLFLWIMGKPIEVYAAFSSYMNDAGVDDSATALIKFQSNVLGNVTVSWLDLPDYQSTGDSRMLEVVGTEGKIDSEFFGPSLFFYGSHSISSKIRGKVRIMPVRFNPRIPDEALKWSYKKEIDSFIESIVSNRKTPVTVDHGFSVLNVVTAAYESAKSKAAISLE
jgi:predicted dehydrogenase